MTSNAACHTVANVRHYCAYGLSLLSEIRLPGLITSAPGQVAEANCIRISRCRDPFAAPYQDIMSWTLPNGQLWLLCAKYEGGYALRFPQLMDFCVDRMGREIVCHSRPDTAADTLQHLLLDQVLPLVLNLRGQDALHATAVLTPYGVCAFTGPTGSGKSTLAARFHSDGFAILSDDCLVLQENGEQILAVPAYPGLRLWNDTLAAIVSEPGLTQPVAHYSAKQRVMTPDLTDHLPATSYPVAAIYSLNRSQTTYQQGQQPVLQSKSLSRRDGLMELLPNVFRLDITDCQMLIRQLNFLEHVVTHIPTQRLQFPSGFDALEQVQRFILAELRAASQAHSLPDIPVIQPDARAPEDLSIYGADRGWEATDGSGLYNG